MINDSGIVREREGEREGLCVCVIITNVIDENKKRNAYVKTFLIATTNNYNDSDTLLLLIIIIS